jgi:hypothetical protein
LRGCRRQSHHERLGNQSKRTIIGLAFSFAGAWVRSSNVIAGAVKQSPAELSSCASLNDGQDARPTRNPDWTPDRSPNAVDLRDSRLPTPSPRRKPGSREDQENLDSCLRRNDEAEASSKARGLDKKHPVQVNSIGSESGVTGGWVPRTRALSGPCPAQPREISLLVMTGRRAP